MKNLSHLFRFLKGHYWLAALSLLFALLSVSCKMAVPFLVGKMIDEIRLGLDAQGVMEAISVYLLVSLGLVVLGVFFRYGFDYSTAVLGQNVVKKMRDELYDALSHVPVSYLDTHSHGDLLLRLTNDIENVQEGLVAGVASLYEGLVQIAITLGFMFYLNWILALVVILLTPLSVVVSRFISSHNAKYFKAQNQELGKINAFSHEMITSLEAIQAYGLEGQKREQLSSLNEASRKASFKAIFAATWINPSTRLVNNIIYGALILLGVYWLLSPATFSFANVAFTVGGLSAFLTYANQYMAPFNEIADAMGQLLNADASLGRVMETILSPKDVDEGEEPLGESIHTLISQHMTFSYDPSRVIIDDFDLEIYSGHKIALVGTTGCGKTTIINLLMRFYDPQEGGFYMNGIPTQRVSKKELRSHIGMVLQDTWLSKASIKDNLAFGKPDATMEEIVAAAKKAHADEFIRRLPQGYDTIVSNASGLSKGEKQLLCVARIILVQPEIVLLDEATSNIDLRTELALADAFDELMKGKTSIVVAHRLSTIKNADLILVMDQGRIVEQGNFQELMAKKGAFASLYLSQLA